MDEGVKIGDQTFDSNEMAVERTIMAYERTQMAWIRTAVSLISFGFTIYKFLGESVKTEGARQFFTPRTVGMIMIGFGLVGLFLAQVQHAIAMRKIRKYYPKMQKSISSLLAIFMLFFGLAMFLAALLRQ